MLTDAAPAQDQRSELVRMFAAYCIECLLTAGKATAGRESAAGSTDPADVLTAGMYRLSGRVENATAGERAMGNNLRHVLRVAGQSSASADVLADGAHLDALCDDIRQQVANQLASSQNPAVSDTVILVGSALTTALIGVHSARLDGNWKGIEAVWSWCGRTLPSGYQPESYTLLRAADYYRQFGSARLAMTGGETIRPPHPDVLDDLLATARRELGDSSEGYALLRRLELFLVDAVSQLPPSELRSGTSHAEWLNKMLEGKPDLHSRFRYNLSRARFAQNRIPEAINLSIEALQSAPPSDLPYIELCRQQLLMLEQEAASRGDIEAELTQNITESLQNSVDDSKEQIRAETQDVVNTSQETIRSEIKDSLLRIIEILGVFLAVAGVAVTTVGGIAAGGSASRAAAIYGIGYATIVSLFFVLRWMVLAPLVVGRKKARKRSDDRSG